MCSFWSHDEQTSPLYAWLYAAMISLNSEFTSIVFSRYVVQPDSLLRSIEVDMSLLVLLISRSDVKVIQRLKSFLTYAKWHSLKKSETQRDILMIVNPKPLDCHPCDRVKNSLATRSKNRDATTSTSWEVACWKIVHVITFLGNGLGQKLALLVMGLLSKLASSVIGLCQKLASSVMAVVRN